MLIWQWGLIGASVLSLSVFLMILWRYWSLKKQVAELGEATPNDGEQEASIADVVEEDAAEKSAWLSLLAHQKAICTQLLHEVADSDEQNNAALSCWATFLDVEKQIIEQDIPNDRLEEVLGAFGDILGKIDRAQAVDELFKSLKVNQSLLSELNKIIKKADDKVLHQVSITAELNIRFDQLQNQLAEETELDVKLAALRAEMASMVELAERLKSHWSEMKNTEGVDEAYVDALEAFLDGTDQSTFLHSMGAEFDHKVADLKHLADYQKNIIADLKVQVRKAKGQENHDKHLGAYDLSMVKLEKSLLESNRVVKRLEHKLESLQTIKYNLNIDIIRQNEALKQKAAQLDNQQETGSDIRDVFEQEHQTMRSMEDLLHQDSFTEEADAFANEQSSKINSLRLMVNESELYVEMLERDLDKARMIRESLEHKLEHPEAGLEEADLDKEATQAEMEEMENLREINQELEEERKRLAAALFDGQSQRDEAEKIQRKIFQLDEKIESIQQKYVAMEERYLTAIMSQE